MPNKPVMFKVIITAVITVALDIAIVYLGTLEFFHLGWSIGCVGIISLFGMLVLSGFLNTNASSLLNTDNIRLALTAAFLSMYFVFVALLSFEDTQITDVIIIQPVISHFTYLVGLVVVFYFATSSISEYLKIRDNSKSPTEQ